MTTAEVAKKLVELCRKGAFEEAIQSLYAPNIVSVEPMEMPGMPRTLEGIDAIRKKTQWWIENHTIHSMSASDPFVSPEKIAVQFDMDVTNKPSGKRMKGSEIAVYTVKNGKIVHEEFLMKQGPG